jgi:hypothetical protein
MMSVRLNVQNIWEWYIVIFERLVSLFRETSFVWTISSYSWVLCLAFKRSQVWYDVLPLISQIQTIICYVSKTAKSNLNMKAEKNPTKCCFHFKYVSNNRQCLHWQIYQTTNRIYTVTAARISNITASYTGHCFFNNTVL